KNANSKCRVVLQCISFRQLTLYYVSAAVCRINEHEVFVREACVSCVRAADAGSKKGFLASWQTAG
uniref:Uncharacterized protein n=1 Tax=Oryza brachyantha TaxID=4533 RepID=J3N6V4_ORYBR